MQPLHRFSFSCILRLFKVLGAMRSILLLLLCCPLQSISAEMHTAKVGQIKSAFIYNIAKFVTWPENLERHPTQLQICFYQRNFIGQAFETLEGRLIHGRIVEKRVVRNLALSQECDILLLHQSELESYQQEYEAESADKGLLTIVDLTANKEQGKVYSGVLMNLVRRKNSIGFEVSLQQVKQRQLDMNSQLLKLATILD